MWGSLFSGVCTIAGSIITSDAITNAGDNIAKSVNNINTTNNIKTNEEKTDNLIDCFWNIIYDESKESYNIDKLYNNLNLLYFTLPKELKFFPNTKPKLALLKFLHSHQEIEIDPNLHIHSPAVLSKGYFYADGEKLRLTTDKSITFGVIKYSNGEYGLYNDYLTTCDASKKEYLWDLQEKISKKFEDECKLWHELKEKNRRAFFAGYTPLSTRELFDKIFNVLVKHYGYNIKEVKFEPMYCCLLSK